MATKDTDKGFRRIRRELLKVPRLRVEVGWQADKIHPNSTLSVVQIAAVHEFGSRDGRIPQRSTLGATADRNRTVYKEIMAGAFGRIVDGSTVRKELAAFGRIARDDVKQAINEASAPPMEPLNPQYRARKLNKGKGKSRRFKASRGFIQVFDNPGVDNSLLKDTLTMRNSVTYKIVDA